MNNSYARKTNVRYMILSMLFAATAINYIDRAALGVAAPVMKDDLYLDAVSLGLVLSAFSWAYTFMQIPGGWLLDRFGARKVYGIGILLWSVFTVLHGFVGSFILLFLLRLAVGFTESPAFPANSRMATMWFPQKERGSATAIYNSAQYFGLALFTPVLTWILHSFGWHHVFIWAGLAGVILAVFWFGVVRNPKDHPRVNKAELEYIQDGGGLANIEDKQKIKWAHVKVLLTNRQLIGIYIGQFALNTIVWFFLTWFPTYLVEAKGLSIIKAGFFASIPYLSAFVGGLVGGYLSDFLLRKGKSLSVARKTPIIIGFILASSIVLANYTDSITLIIGIMSISFFAKGMAGLTWSLVGEIAPKQMLGLSGGIFNCIGNMAGIITPIAIGYILQKTQSFNGALIFICIIVLIGALSYIFIVGNIRRIEIDLEEELPLSIKDEKDTKREM
ncbi:MFS transporter [Priestia filamentosa]|uniref:MFS transporter n=1 Tax=Priestia filamentosa TaxID=1402861 RepID=UPI001FB24C37|nr:MFS transporter [Priestia filamentosa]MED3726431.1 MFS transporter [Priestia filamentosa]UOE60414.1 MFS transporter [Priestia filamentosa]